MTQTPNRPPDLALDRGEFLPVLALCALDIPLSDIQALAHEADAQGRTLAEMVRHKLAADQKYRRREETDREKAAV